MLSYIQGPKTAGSPLGYKTCRGQNFIQADLSLYMAITREQKKTITAKLRDIVENARTIVFVRFSGVTSEEANALRTACAAEGVGYMVAKKTLIRRVFGDSAVDGTLTDLEGEIAIAYGSDMLAPARVMGEQEKALDGRLSIVGGVFENAFAPQEKMQSIAAIPPMEVLYGQFVMVINSPIQQCASVFSRIADTK